MELAFEITRYFIKNYAMIRRVEFNCPLIIAVVFIIIRFTIVFVIGKLVSCAAVINMQGKGISRCFGGSLNKGLHGNNTAFFYINRQAAHRKGLNDSLVSL